jgi:hypothetical protein
MNQLNRTKTRREAEPTANNIERADCLMQETVAGRHYQHNTNHVQRQKHRMHISAGKSTDWQACADIDQVHFHHHFYFFYSKTFYE